MVCESFRVAKRSRGLGPEQPGAKALKLSALGNCIMFRPCHVAHNMHGTLFAGSPTCTRGSDEGKWAKSRPGKRCNPFLKV